MHYVIKLFWCFCLCVLIVSCGGGGKTTPIDQGTPSDIPSTEGIDQVSPDAMGPDTPNEDAPITDAPLTDVTEDQADTCVHCQASTVLVQWELSPLGALNLESSGYKMSCVLETSFGGWSLQSTGYRLTTGFEP